MAPDRGGYLAGLTLFRAGQTDQWVAWFAEAVPRSSLAMVGVVDDVARLLDQWALQLADTKADAAAPAPPRPAPGLLLSGGRARRSLGAGGSLSPAASG
jgi:hypothetical protein